MSGLISNSELDISARLQTLDTRAQDLEAKTQDIASKEEVAQLQEQLDQLGTLEQILSAAYDREWEVGSVREWLSNTMPQHGTWLLMDGKTVGDSLSGATARANDDTFNLFAYLWANISQADLPIQTSSGGASTRGASAAADFAAHKRLPVPDTRDRTWRGNRAGRGLGSYEADALQWHIHYQGVNSSGAGSNLTVPQAYGYANYISTSYTSGPADDGTNGTPRTASETRVKNLSCNYIIRCS